jgi:cytochrome c-type biogenesis protein CcmH
MFSSATRLKRAAVLFLTVAFAVTLLGASGDAPRFYDLGHRMMCVCGCNQVLLECNHVGCQYSDGMREQLLAKVRKDSSDDSVLQSFVQEYGTTVLAAPTTRGFDKLAWVMPFAVFFAGSFTAAAVIRNWKSRAPLDGASTHASQEVVDKFREQARKETEL